MARKESITLVLKNKLQKEYTLDNMIEYFSVLLENNSRLTMFKTDYIEIVSRFLINESKYIIDDGKINRKRDKQKELKAAENGYHLYRFSYLNDPKQFIKEIIEIIGEFDENQKY